MAGIKKILIALILTLMWCSISLAATTYHVTQGGGVGANPLSATQFNALSGDKAGDIYYFSGTFTTRITVYISGTNGSPVTLDGYQAGDCDPINSVCSSSAKLDAGMHVGNQIAGPDYIIVQDFRMQNGSSTDGCFVFYPYIAGNDDQSHIDHIIVRRNYVYQVRNVLFYYYNGRHVIIEGNKFVHFGQGGFNATQAINIIQVNNALFTGNEFGHDQDLYPATGADSPNIVEIHGCYNQLWEYNDVYGSPTYGANLGFKEWGPAGNIIVRFNKVHDSDQVGITWGGGTDELNYFYVYGNYIYNNGQSAAWVFDNADLSYWWSNIMSDNGQHAFVTWQRGQGVPDTILIINNTFSRNGKLNEVEAGRGGVTLSAGSDINIKNNLFYNNRPGGASSMYHQIFELGQSPVLEHNTMWHDSDSGGKLYWYYSGGLRNLATMQGTYSRENVVPKGVVTENLSIRFTNPDGADTTYGTDDDDYTITSIGTIGADLSQCFTEAVDLSGGDAWMETNSGYGRYIEPCLNDALDPNNTDWTTTPPTVAVIDRDTYGWARGAYASTGCIEGSGTETCTVSQTGAGADYSAADFNALTGD